MGTYYTDENGLTQKLITLHGKKSDLCYHEHNQDRFKAALEKNLATPPVSEFTKIIGGLVSKIDKVFTESYEQGSFSGKLREDLDRARDEICFKYCRDNTKLVGLLITQLARKQASGEQIKVNVENFITEHLELLAAPAQTFLYVDPTDRARLTELMPRSNEILWGKNRPAPADLADKITAAGLDKYYDATGGDRATRGTPQLALNFTQQICREDLEALWEYNELQDAVRDEFQGLQAQIQALTSAQCKFSPQEAGTYPKINPVQCRLAPDVSVKDIDRMSYRYQDIYISDMLNGGARAVRRLGVTNGGLASDGVIYINNIKNIELLKEQSRAL